MLDNLLQESSWPALIFKRMKTYSCYTCTKEFKTSRSLASHNFKFHSSKNSVSSEQSLKTDSSNLCNISSNRLQGVNGETMSESLVELKTLFGRLNRNFEIQQEKVEDLDKKVLQLCSNETNVMTNKLGKVIEAVKAHNQQSFEEMIHDTLFIQRLLKKGGQTPYTMRNKAMQLKNAALAIYESFSFDWDKKLVLRMIIHSSFAETKEHMKENWSALEAIFSALPPEDELEELLRMEESVFDLNHEISPKNDGQSVDEQFDGQSDGEESEKERESEESHNDSDTDVYTSDSDSDDFD